MQFMGAEIEISAFLESGRTGQQWGEFGVQDKGALRSDMSLGKRYLKNWFGFQDRII
jgi:hypothetical protein